MEGNKIRSNADYNKNFDLLDLRHIEKAFKLLEVKLVDDKIYIASQRDKWYVEYSDGTLILYHKNNWNQTNRHHRQDKKFNTVFNIFSYINKHDKFIFLKSFKELRFEKLFNQISLR